MRALLTSLPLAALLAACGSASTQDVAMTQGANPQLGAPQTSTFPTVNVAKGEGWPAGKMPTPAAGLAVNQFAGDLNHPRWLLQLANGDVLVAETDNPGTDKTGGTIKSIIQGLVMKKAGSSKGSPNKIMLLRDADGDGVAETKTVLLDHDLYSPFGMVVVGGELFVANANAVVAFPFTPGQTAITAKPRLVTELPSGYNHHWTKSLVASPDGRFLYVGIGSNSNVGENGLEMEKGRAAVWQIDPKSGRYAIFASGLRNPVGIAFNPESGALWTVVNERDELGNDLVPDYLTSVQQGAFYGWPFSYYGQHVDTRPPANPAMVAKAIAPDFALGSHVAALGLTFSTGQTLGGGFASGAFIGEHGSWNRKPASGYEVVFVPFAGARPTGAKPIPILTGFRVGDTAYGRPVGVQVGKDGSLLVADDVGGKVWRVSAGTLPQQVTSR
ncbi:sorbosone dehydrogenase family protein [Sphingomonas sp.]|uniref:PQQ-dependent sugar dehydrogenase n=1 Tax=Sphingomonas sp. TaxID=28214 RepID=UPI00286AC840|nr:sorbosone dehydrogenase family protein [Sphingomonas sp.]